MRFKLERSFYVKASDVPVDPPAPDKIRMRISGTDSVNVPGTEGYQSGRCAYLWDGKSDYYRSWYA